MTVAHLPMFSHQSIDCIDCPDRDLARSGGTSKMVWRQNVDFLLVTHLGPFLLLLSRHSCHPTSLFSESHSFLSLTQIENAFDVDEA